MRDVDFLLPVDKRILAYRALGEVGIVARPDLDALDEPDAHYYADEHGLWFDIHHRFRIFEKWDLSDLTEKQLPKFLNTGPITVFEPNALIAHLVNHIQGHRRDEGYVLGWLLEFALVTQNFGDRLDIDRIKILMPTEAMYQHALRTWSFCETCFGLSLPESVRQVARRVEPFTFPEVIRSRRNALWGLPQPRGWLRLGASFVRTPAQPRPRPALSDLLTLPADLLREKRALRARH